MCVGVCLGLFKAHAHSHSGQAIHVWECVFGHVQDACCHGDCCEAMHACVCGSMCLGLCNAHAVTLIAARRCMHVWECVFCFSRGVWSL